MKKGIIVTNIPAIYRIDLFSFLGACGFKIFFYNLNSKVLNYCYYKDKLEFPWEKVNFWNLFFKLVKEDPDAIVCINASHITFICGLYASLFRKKFIIWWAGTPLSEKNISFYKKLFRRLVFSLSVEFLAYSEFAAEYLDYFHIPEGRIKILGNVTFDPDKFYNRVKEFQNSLTKGKYITILSVGNLVKRKNHDFLIDVYSELKGKYDNIRLLIVGDGPEKAKLMEKVKTNNIKDIEFLGRVENEDIYSVYGIADIFIHTALMDQWPQAVNEALASKLPVVVSESSGISEILFENGKDLYICDLDKKNFVSSIEKLITDEALRQTLSNNGYNKIKDMWKRAISIFLDLFEKE